MKPARVLLLLFAVSLAARIPFLAQTTDDAYITYRYAENIAAGMGFVYNPGERVLGVTTPLYTLLLALFAVLGLKPLLAGPWINILADGLVAPLLAKYGRPTDPGRYVAPLLYAVSPLNAYWSASGMETGLFCFCIALAIASYVSEQPRTCGVALGAALLLRIDAAILVVVLLADYLARNRRFPWIESLFTLIVAGPWFIFSTLYFGGPLPQSIYAKAALPHTGIGAALIDILVKGFLKPGTPFGLILLLGALSAALLSRRSLGSIWALYAAAHMLAYTATRSQLHPWYYPPAWVGYISVAAAGLTALASTQRVRRFAPAVVIVAAAAGAAGLVIAWNHDLPAEIELDAFLRDTGRAVGRMAPEGSTLFLKDIGYLGYYSGLCVDDFAGLISPQLVPYRARLDVVGAIRRARSDFVLLGSGFDTLVEKDAWFVAHYSTDQIFRSGGKRMVLYRRLGKVGE